MGEAVRITRKARTLSAIAAERNFIKATAALAKEQGKKVVVSLPARKTS